MRGLRLLLASGRLYVADVCYFALPLRTAFEYMAVAQYGTKGDFCAGDLVISGVIIRSSFRFVSSAVVVASFWGCIISYTSK